MYGESFNGKIRDECLHGETFDSLVEATVLIERWQREYSQVRLHSALGYWPPAPEAIPPLPPGSAPPGANVMETNLESGSGIGRPLTGMAIMRQPVIALAISNDPPAKPEALRRLAPPRGMPAAVGEEPLARPERSAERG